MIDINKADRGARLDPESGALLIDGWPYPDHGTHLEVTELGGRDSGTVPIRRQYEPLIRRALEPSAHGPADALVLGHKETRRNVTTHAPRHAGPVRRQPWGPNGLPLGPPR